MVSEVQNLIGNGPGRTTATINATAEPIGRLATLLSGELGRPVIDETGLEGQFDFKLNWTREVDSSTPNPPEESGPSIFTALTDQLGLRLQWKKGPVVVYVVEEIHPPSENRALVR